MIHCDSTRHKDRREERNCSSIRRVLRMNRNDSPDARNFTLFIHSSASVDPMYGKVYVAA